MSDFDDDYVPDDPDKAICNNCGEIAELETKIKKGGSCLFRYACQCGLSGYWGEEEDALNAFVTIKTY